MARSKFRPFKGQISIGEETINSYGNGGTANQWVGRVQSFNPDPKEEQIEERQLGSRNIVDILKGKKYASHSMELDEQFATFAFYAFGDLKALPESITAFKLDTDATTLATASVSLDGTTIVVAAAGTFAANDIVIIYDTTAGSLCMEINRIASIDGTTFTLTYPLEHDYTITATNIKELDGNYLASATEEGATTFTLTSGTKFTSNDYVIIWDGGRSEIRKITLSGAVCTVTALAFPHAAGTMVIELDDEDATNWMQICTAIEAEAETVVACTDTSELDETNWGDLIVISTPTGGILPRKINTGTADTSVTLSKGLHYATDASTNSHMIEQLTTYPMRLYATETNHRDLRSFKMTAWMGASTNLERYWQGCVVDTYELKCNIGEPLSASVEIKSKFGTKDTGARTALDTSTTERKLKSFHWANCKIEYRTTGAWTTMSNARGFSFKISNGIELGHYLGTSQDPTDFTEDMREYEFSLDIIPAVAATFVSELYASSDTEYDWRITFTRNGDDRDYLRLYIWDTIMKRDGADPEIPKEGVIKQTIKWHFVHDPSEGPCAELMWMSPTPDPIVDE